MSSKWITKPITIGVRTRYRVMREDGSETRGDWDRRKDAANLAFRLNADDWDREVFEDDSPDEF